MILKEVAMKSVDLLHSIISCIEAVTQLGIDSVRYGNTKERIVVGMLVCVAALPSVHVYSIVLPYLGENLLAQALAMVLSILCFGLMICIIALIVSIGLLVRIIWILFDMAKAYEAERDGWSD